MKKALCVRVVISLLVMIMVVVLLQNFSLANSENTQILKLTDKEYLIYVEGLLNDKFEFALSKNAKDSNLKFINSAKDKEKGNHIAYVDSDLYDTYFSGKGKTFLWVKQGKEYKIEAQEVNLSTALEEEKIQNLNQVTKKIAVKVGEKELPTENKDGVEVNRKIGTLKLEEKEKATYTYQMLKKEPGSEVEKLIELANKMNKQENKDMFAKLRLYSEFESAYNKLVNGLSKKKWIKVDDFTIPQPQEAKTGEQYIVVIKENTSKEENTNKKENTSKEETIDIQIMTCKDEQTQEYETKDVVIKETSKLPITYDNIVLFVIAGVVLLLIILVVVLKLRNKKEEK